MISIAERIAILGCRTAVLEARIAGMASENTKCLVSEQPLVYDNASFQKAIEESGCLESEVQRYLREGREEEAMCPTRINYTTKIEPMIGA